MTQHPSTHYVTFSAEIVPHTTESLLATFANFVNSGVQEAHLLISTPGGSVMHGLNLYNVLSSLPLRLITHNVGSVNSIGNAVFLAGEERYACPNSTFMFHGVGFDVQNTRFEEKLLRERLGSILADQKRIASIIEERTSLSTDEIGKLFAEAKTMNAADAVGAGIVDELKDVKVPSGCPIVSLVFQR